MLWNIQSLRDCWWRNWFKFPNVTGLIFSEMTEIISCDLLVGAKFCTLELLPAPKACQPLHALQRFTRSLHRKKNTTACNWNCCCFLNHHYKAPFFWFCVVSWEGHSFIFLLSLHFLELKFTALLYSIYTLLFVVSFNVSNTLKLLNWLA